jgi:Delta3-Delta2-enoyl-CoA isomerase
MEFVRSERDGRLLVVTISRGKANALNSSVVEELHLVFQDAEQSDDIRGVVLASDRPKFFSAGFDVVEVFSYDRQTMHTFFGRFMDLYERMLRFPKPLVAAVSGHAYAGGAVLALACDARVMARGDFGFALNEINLGIVLPPGMIRMVAQAVGATGAREMVVGGQTLTSQRALELGLAVETADPNDTLARSKAQAEELAAKPPAAFKAIKRLFLESTGQHPVGNDREWLDQFIEYWFSAECMERKQALIDSLRS